jgi:MFS family permease
MQAGGSVDVFLKELVWRDYAQNVIVQMPEYGTKNARDAFDKLPWRDVSDPAVQAGVLGMASVSGVLVGVSYGLIRKVVPSSFVVVLILFFWAAGQSWIGLSHGPVQTGAAVALSGIGSGLMFAYLPALLLSRLDQRHHAAGLGLYYSTMFIGDFVNPLFMGAIRTVVPDYHAVFLTIGIICGVIGLFTLLRGLRLRGREDADFSKSHEQA